MCHRGRDVNWYVYRPSLTFYWLTDKSSFRQSPNSVDGMSVHSFHKHSSPWHTYRPMYTTYFISLEHIQKEKQNTRKIVGKERRYYIVWSFYNTNKYFKTWYKWSQTYKKPVLYILVDKIASLSDLYCAIQSAEIFEPLLSAVYLSTHLRLARQQLYKRGGAWHSCQMAIYPDY